MSGIEYRIEYRWFRDALAANTSGRCRRLASEWDRKLPTRIDLPLDVTLRHHSCFVNTHDRGIFPKFYNKDARGKVVRLFFESDGKDGVFSLGAQQRLKASERFAQDQRRRERQERAQRTTKHVNSGMYY